MNEKEFIKNKAESIRQNIRSFPADFMDTAEGEKMDLPDKTLIPGKEFFGNMEITTLDGKPWYMPEDPQEGKFIIYSRQNGLRELIIPADKKILLKAVSMYENYLDSLMKEISREYKKQFPEGDAAHAVSAVFRILNLVRY